MRRRNSSVRFIVIALIEHLGDIVACEPVSRYLRGREPGSVIIWLVKEEYRELLESNPNIDLVITVHCLSEKDYLAKCCNFDRFVDLHFAERFCAICDAVGTRRQGRSKSKITLNNFYNYGNILQSFSLFAGLPELNDPPHIYIDKSSKSHVDALNLPAQFVVFHCLSNAHEKTWPREYWNRLSHHICSVYGWHIVEVGVKRIQNDLEGDMYINTSGRLKILETAEVIHRSKLFVGIDSGPAHIANSLHVPGIILFGSYLGFSDYMPYGGGYSDDSNAIILRSPGTVAEISVEQVINTVDKSIVLMNQ